MKTDGIRNTHYVHRQDLTPLLDPRSIAIVGISTPPRFGGRVYQNLRDFGYPGEVFGVNPRYERLHDQPCYSSLRDLPCAPDLAILAVSNNRLLAAMRDAAAIGVRAVVTSSSAQLPHAEGEPTLQAQLAEVARAHGMVMCGPNGMGFIAFARRAAAWGYPLVPLPAGPITFISHSGTLADAMWQNRRGLRFNYIISPGNEIVTTLADYMQHALADESTRVIGLFLETVRDPETFCAALAEAAERDVPVVALKVGRSERGAQLALAHSGALAGEDAVYDALFDHYGVRRVRTPDEMLDTLELFAAKLRPRTRAITAMHDSGGERGLLVDLAEAEGVEFAAITAETTEKLAAVLDPALPPVNPVDAWGTGHDFAQVYRQCLLALDADPNAGLTVWAADMYAAGDLTESYVRTAIELKSQLRNPLVFLTNLAGAADEALCNFARAHGFPVLLGTESGLRAIRHVIEYTEHRREAPIPPPLSLSRNPCPPDDGKPLDEYDSLQLLARYGITVAESRIATSLAEAQCAARELGYPVALKTATGAAHKTDADGVRLNLSDEAAVEAAYRSLSERLGARVLVQRMATPGVELLLGLTRDPQFGLLLTLGLGGIFVEVLRDTRLLMLPLRPEAVRRALRSLRGAAVLAGARGRPPVDLEAIVQTALRLNDLAADLGERLIALDINPLIASPHGAVAVDALTVLCPKGM
ncbi:MAG: acetate--CoA ligase family protein [Anaerolineales bacterium]|nr:acetate--CoA ligase family protein [Anaerolineales bacterium]